MTPTLITRFVLFLPAPGSTLTPEHGRRLDSLSRQLGLQSQAIDGLPFFADATPPGRSQTRAWLDVFPGKRLSGRDFSVPGDDIAALDTRAEQQAQAYHLICGRQHCLHLQGDALGLKPLFMTDIDGGLLLATRLVDLLRIEPALVQPLDWIALQQMLTGRATMGNRTLHSKISRLPSGTSIRWSAQDGIMSCRDRRWRFPVVDPLISHSRFAQDVEDALSNAISCRVGNDVQPLATAMSGGFDSRVVAGMTQHLGYGQEGYTYGLARHADVHYAKQVCGKLGIPFHRVPFDRDETLNRLATNTALFEGCIDFSIGQSALLACPDISTGRTLLHGFAGDLVNGAILERLPASSYDNFEDLARGCAQHYGKRHIDYDRLFGRSLGTDAYDAAIVEDIDKSLPPFQAGILWWWENQIRRYTMRLFIVLSQKVDLVAPLIDKQYCDAWAQLPRCGLEYRAMFNQWFTRRFPALARIPHADVGMITPSLRGQLDRFLFTLPSNVLNAVVGKVRAEQIRTYLGRNGTTYQWANLVTAPQQVRVHRLLEEMRGDLASILGIELAPDYWWLLDGQSQARRVLLGIAAYARHLRRELADTAVA